MIKTNDGLNKIKGKIASKMRDITFTIYELISDIKNSDIINKQSKIKIIFLGLSLFYRLPAKDNF